MSGKGTYTYPNGNKYEGEWQDDVKSGYGVLQYVNGEKYEGFWKDDTGLRGNTITHNTGQFMVRER